MSRIPRTRLKPPVAWSNAAPTQRSTIWPSRPAGEIITLGDLFELDLGVRRNEGAKTCSAQPADEIDGGGAVLRRRLGDQLVDVALDAQTRSSGEVIGSTGLTTTPRRGLNPACSCSSRTASARSPTLRAAAKWARAANSRWNSSTVISPPPSALRMAEARCSMVAACARPGIETRKLTPALSGHGLDGPTGSSGAINRGELRGSCLPGAYSSKGDMEKVLIGL
jgi:hypothetical protein